MEQSLPPTKASPLVLVSDCRANNAFVVGMRSRPGNGIGHNLGGGGGRLR